MSERKGGRDLRREGERGGERGKKNKRKVKRETGKVGWTEGRREKRGREGERYGKRERRGAGRDCTCGGVYNIKEERREVNETG